MDANPALWGCRVGVQDCHKRGAVLRTFCRLSFAFKLAFVALLLGIAMGFYLGMGTALSGGAAHRSALDHSTLFQYLPASPSGEPYPS